MLLPYSVRHFDVLALHAVDIADQREVSLEALHSEQLVEEGRQKTLHKNKSRNHIFTQWTKWKIQCDFK